MYSKLFFKYLKCNLNIWLQYFWDFMSLLLNSIISLIIGIVTISIIFRETAYIGGWNKSEVIFLLGYIYLTRSIFNTFFINCLAVGEYIQSGELDLFLTKPLSAWFQILTAKRYNTEYPLDELIIGLIILCYSYIRLEMKNFNLLILIVYLAFSVIIYVAIVMIISSVAFWTVKFESGFEILSGVEKVTEYPLTIFPRTIKGVLYTVLPLALVSYYPVKRLLLKSYSSMEMFFYILGLVFFPIIAKCFWSIGLKRYSSPNS